MKSVVMVITLLIVFPYYPAKGELLYLRTNSDDIPTLDNQIGRLNKMGLHVRHIFPPNELIAEISPLLEPTWPRPSFVLESYNRLQLLYHPPFDCQLYPVKCAARYLQFTPHSYGDTIDLVLDGCEDGGITKFADSSQSTPPRTDPAQRYNAMYMIGRTAVSFLFMESIGNAENWTALSRQDMFEQAVLGLDWWCNDAVERNVDVSFVYEIHWTIPTTFEPIQGNTTPYYSLLLWNFDWIGEALQHLG